MTEAEQGGDWAFLGDCVRRRRLRLGLSQREAADRGPMSPTTWGQVEAGRPGRSGLTLAAVGKVLGWEERWHEVALGGEEPAEDTLVIGTLHRADGTVEKAWVGDGPDLSSEDRDIVLAATDGFEDLDSATQAKVAKRFREIIDEARSAG